MGKKKGRAHFTPFQRGAIYGLHVAGWALREIAEEVPKSDGSVPSQQAVRAAIKAPAEAGGYLSGGASHALSAAPMGRPRATTDALDKAILKVVLKHRGRVMVGPRGLIN